MDGPLLIIIGEKILSYFILSFPRFFFFLKIIFIFSCHFSEDSGKFSYNSTPNAAAFRDFNGTNRSETVSHLLKTSHRGYGSNSGQYMNKKIDVTFKIILNARPMKSLIHDISIARQRKKCVDRKRITRHLGDIYINEFSQKNENWPQSYSRLKTNTKREKILINYHKNLIESYLFYLVTHFLNYSILTLI